jgi:molecular chaperone DnaK
MHAAEDRKFHELVDARNRADNMIHAVNKAIKDLGDKVPADEAAKAKAAIEELQAAMKGDDKAAIEEKTNALAQASARIAEKAYAQQQDAGGAAGTGAEGQAAKENVVDAEFEEVKKERGGKS